jgi:hypothetical protein
MLMNFSTLRATRAGLLLSALALGCGDGGTDATPPAPPTGTILALHPIGDMYLLDPATSVLRQFSSFGHPVGWVTAALTPGARQVSGADYRDQQYYIRLVDLATGANTDLLVASDTTALGSTRLSPSGTRLAFSGGGWEGVSHNALYLLDLATGQITVPWQADDTTEHSGLGSVHWLPDESGIVAIASGAQTNRIAHIDFASHTVTYLTEAFGNRYRPSMDLSPDGRTVAYSGQEGKIRFITLTGEPAPGYPESIAGVLATFSPDGRFLAYTPINPNRPSSADGIWLHRFADGAEWRLLPEESEVTWVLDWE